MRCQSGWRHEPGNYKSCPNEAVTSLKSEQVAFRHEGDMAGDATFVPSSGNWGYSRNRKFSQLLVLSLYNKKLRELWNVLKNKLRTQKSAEAGCLKHLSLLFFFLPVYRHTLLLRCYFAGDEQWLVSFKNDAWNWGSSDQRILFFTVWWSFRCFYFANSKYVFMCLHWGKDWVLLHHHKSQIVECCSDVCPSVGFSYLHMSDSELIYIHLL